MSKTLLTQAVLLALCSSAIAASITETTTYDGDTTITVDTATGEATSRYAGIISTAQGMTVTVANGVLTVQGNQTDLSGAQGLDGVYTASGASLTVTGDTTIDLTASSIAVGGIRAHGQTTFDGTTAVKATGGSQMVSGVELWNDAVLTFKGDETRIEATSTTGNPSVYGVRNHAASGVAAGTVSFEAAKTDITVASTSNSTAVRIDGVYVSQSTTQFQGDTTITVTGGNTVYGVDAESDPGSKATVVAFNGSNTEIKVSGSNLVYGISSSGATDINFTGQSVTISAVSTGSILAAGLTAQ